MSLQGQQSHSRGLTCSTAGVYSETSGTIAQLVMIRADRLVATPAPIRRMSEARALETGKRAFYGSAYSGLILDFGLSHYDLLGVV